MYFFIGNGFRNNRFPYLYVTDERITLVYFGETEQDEEIELIESEDELHSILSSVREHWLPSEYRNIAVAGQIIGAVVEKTYKVRSVSTFSLDSSLGRGETTGRDTWIIFSSNATGNLTAPINVSVSHSDTKPQGERKFTLFPDTVPAAQIFIPLPNKPLLSSYNIFVLNVNPQVGFGTNIDKGLFEPVSIMNKASPFVRFEIDGEDFVSADQPSTFTVRAFYEGKLLDEDLSLYLDSSAGYLPVRKVELRGGIGYFRFVPLGMYSGELAKLKLSWKYYTGEAEKIVEVR